MPTPELMTWIPSQRRWTRMHRGKRYYISARQLGCPETREGSRQAANEWWRGKQAEIDYTYRREARQPKPLEDVATAVLGVSWDELFNRFMCSFKRFISEADAREAAERDANYAIEHVWRELGKTIIENKPLPDGIRKHLPPARAAQVERAIKELRGERAAEPERTVGALVDKWLAEKQDKAYIGGLSPSRLASLRVHMAHVKALFGENTDAASLEEESLESAYRFCLAKIAERRKDPEEGWSASYGKEVFTAARCFVRWLVETNIIDKPPRNLNSRRFTFGITAKEIKVWTVEEVSRVVGAASGVLRLAMLLQLNCGMTQKDASDLLDSEVNWQEGRIVRKRSKTRNNEDTPEVDYTLWPCTFALLKEHRSGRERVLLTKRGRPYVHRRLIDGTFHAVDSLGDFYRRLAKKMGFTKPMKLLRKTGATLLDKFDPSGRVSTLYLGHSPRSMKDRHYSRPDQAYFDRAITWLGQQLGFVDPS